MTRHQRRKLAKKLACEHNQRLLKANAAFERDLQVKRNLSSKPKRKGFSLSETGELAGGYGYYPQSSMADILGHSHRGYVCRAIGAMSKRGAQALKAKGAW